MSTANLTDADLAAIEARLAGWQDGLKMWGYEAVDVWTAVADLADLLAAVREARAERDAAYAAADDLEGKYRQLVTAHDELTTALNAAAMEVNARRFWGTRMIESIPSYLREVGKRIAALERERDEARRLADRLLLACDRAHELKDTRNE